MKAVYIGGNCVKVEKVDSTNNYLSELITKQNLPEGTVVTTDEQNTGRGQRGTQWESEPGKNITLSILLQPVFIEAAKQFELSKTVALAVFDFVKHVLSEKGIDVRIKWPNDIYIDRKKVAGILIENILVANKIASSIVGIGININQTEFSSTLFSATSMINSTGKEYALEECRELLYYFLEKRYLQLRTHPRTIESEYLLSLLFFKEWGSYFYQDKKIIAKITGVNKSGKLILEKENLELVECDIKEIRFLL